MTIRTGDNQEDDLDELEPNLDEDPGVITEDLEGDQGKNEPGSDGDEEEDEVFLEGSQPKKKQPSNETRYVSDRIKKKNRKIDDLTAHNAELNASLNAVREKNKMLEMITQPGEKQPAPQALVRPKASDFDEGAEDPVYLDALDNYYEKKNKLTMDQSIQDLSQQTTRNAQKESQARALEGKTSEHFQRGEKLTLKTASFEELHQETEDILGPEIMNVMISSYKNSHLMAAYYGKYPDEAEKLRGIMAKDQVLGVSQLGVLSDRLKVRRKSTRLPEPDEEMQGGHAPARLQKRGPPGAKFDMGT